MTTNPLDDSAESVVERSEEPESSAQGAESDGSLTTSEENIDEGLASFLEQLEGNDDSAESDDVDDLEELDADLDDALDDKADAEQESEDEDVDDLDDAIDDAIDKEADEKVDTADFDITADIPLSRKEYKALPGEVKGFIAKARKQHKEVQSRLNESESLAEVARSIFQDGNRVGLGPEKVNDFLDVLFRANAGDSDAITVLGDTALNAGYQPPQVRGDIDFSALDEFMTDELAMSLDDSQMKQFQRIVKGIKDSAAPKDNPDRSKMSDKGKNMRQAAIDEQFEKAHNEAAASVQNIAVRLKSHLDSRNENPEVWKRAIERADIRSRQFKLPETVEEYADLPRKFAEVLKEEIKDARVLLAKTSKKRRSPAAGGLPSGATKGADRRNESGLDMFLRTQTS